ncbi:hypothetical protein MAM1_0007c00834 [Mucor ambiguus]|uniref:Uncharacterized protein n=1 Tax=Mucor ambiguus TaxID=91626 RepID=A0A0C9M0A3_9FUNG|nr:hypothetical protein MAM1_0007c00834 [Mucor ambiguus]
MLFLGAHCCCDCRSLAVLVMLSLGKPVLFNAAVLAFAVLVLSTAAAAVLASAVCCRSLAVLVLSTTTTAAAAVHLLSLSW